MYKNSLNLRNVATIVACLAVTMFFSTCKSKKRDKDQDSKVGVIKASEVISESNASAIIVQNVISSEESKEYFSDVITYRTKDYSFGVKVAQETLHDTKSNFEKSLIKKGWKSYLSDMEKNLAAASTEVNVGGGKAYLQDAGILMLYIFYKDYYITLSLYSYGSAQEDNSWKKQRLTEGGKVAVINLENILRK